MTRGIGLERSLAAALEPAEPLLALVTQLGDTWFLVAIGVGLYWFEPTARPGGLDRRQGFVVLSVALWAVAATYVLKTVVAVPRPPGAAEPAYAVDGALGVVYADIATASGFGFPSGHATATAAVYGTLAWLGSERGRSRRVAIAATIVGVVSLTRVGLGLHFLVDVVAGALLGVVIAAAAVRLQRRPAAILGLAGVTAGVQLFLGPTGPRTVALFGLAAGLFVAWLWVDGGDVGGDTATPRDWYWALPGLAVLAAATAAWLGAVPQAVALATFGGGALIAWLPVASRARKK